MFVAEVRRPWKGAVMAGARPCLSRGPVGTALWYLRRPVAIIALVVVAVVVSVLLVTAHLTGEPQVRSSGHAILVPTSTSLLTHAQAPTANPSSMIGCVGSARRTPLPTSGTEPTRGSRVSWPAVRP